MPKNSSQSDRIPGLNLALFLVVLLGLGIRVWGILWSLPVGQGSFHPDEVFQVAAAANIHIGSLNPHFYNYGAWYMYLVSAVTGLASGAGLIDPMSMPGRFLVARLVTALLGAAVSYFVYRIGSRLYDRKVGLLAAVAAAVTPIAVQHSHFATVDIPATFWIAACLAFSADAFRKGAARDCALAGLCAGFAGATKYTAAMVLIAPIAALLTGVYGMSVRKKLTIAPWILIGGIAGFVIGNPGSVLWTGEFLKGFTSEFQHAGLGHGFVFTNTGPGWLFHLKSSLLCALGLPYLICALAGLALMACDKSRRGWFMLIFFVVYYVVISLSEVRFARYIIPLTPILAIAFTVTVATAFDLISRMRWGSLRLRQSLLASWFALCLAIAYYTLGYTVALDRLFVERDPRVSAANWINRNVPAGSTIALPTQPWFFSPALSPGFTDLLPSDRLEAMAAVTKYHLVSNPDREWDSDVLRSANYAIISDYEDIDAERAKDPDALAYLQLVRSEFAPVEVISNRLRGGGIDFGPADSLPHDMKYASPRITIYKRRV
jgi:4-amino-4-deoxy-L-arabinose transferase-like glycosyltransferase